MPYKILSLDGGGSWALIQAYALGDMFGMDTPGHVILRHYDLVAANSGGSIVLGALCCGSTPREILNFFLNEEKRKKIFARRRKFNLIGVAQAFGLNMGYRYVTEKKLTGLVEQLDLMHKGLAEKSLPDVATHINSFALPSSTPHTHLLIVGFDYHTHRAKYFRSNIHSRASASPGRPLATTLAEALHASSNAPVNYFDAPAKVGDRLYWDGAITGHNNPVTAATIEAFADKAVPGDIAILSIGTGTVVLPHPDLDPNAARQDPNLFLAIKEYNLKNDILKIATSIVDDPPDAATFITHVIAGAPAISQVASSVVRMSPLVQPIRTTNNEFGYPVFSNASAGTSAASPLGRNKYLFLKLKDLDMDAVKQEEVEWIKILCESWLTTDPLHSERCCLYNQPVQAKPDLSVNIGHRYYVEAKAAAAALGLYA